MLGRRKRHNRQVWSYTGNHLVLSEGRVHRREDGVKRADSDTSSFERDSYYISNIESCGDCDEELHLTGVSRWQGRLGRV